MRALLKLLLFDLVLANLKRYDPDLQDTSRMLDMVESQELATETSNIVLYPEFCHETQLLWIPLRSKRLASLKIYTWSCPSKSQLYLVAVSPVPAAQHRAL